MGKVYILNSAVITAPGLYRYRLISPEEAKVVLQSGFVSTIGYEETAAVLTEMLGIQIPVNRTTIRMEAGDVAVVFRISLPPGSPRIDPKDKGQILAILDKKQFELGLLERLE